MDVDTHYSQVCNSTQVEWKDANAIAFLWTGPILICIL
jgi:hypothetical protein